MSRDVLWDREEKVFSVSICPGILRYKTLDPGLKKQRELPGTRKDSVKKQKIIPKTLKPTLAIQTLRMYSNEVKGAPQNPDLLLRSYMVGRVLLRPSHPTIKHIYTYQIKKSVQPTGYDAI